jgi:sulfur carrier protein ThiS adenylyltransferase
VGIAGVGGLGSNCAVALARSGIGTLVIADFDVVTGNNLNRQHYFYKQIGMKKVEALKENILLINPQIQVIIHDIKLNESNIKEIFSKCQIIVEAIDSAEEKKMLMETVIINFPEKPLISGLGMAGYGKFDLLKIRQTDNLYICGDELSEVSDDNPALAPRVGIVSAMQADVVLELLLNDY